MILASNDFATALFMLAVEEDKLDEIYGDLLKVKDVFKENPDYAVLLNSPSLPKHERTKLINAAFYGSIGEYTLNFLKVMCEHNKITEIYECIKVFSALRKQAENRVTAKVYSAVPLSDEQLERLKEKLHKKLSSEVKLKTVIDENMLGGIKIEFEDKVIDGSVRKQLHDIKEVISG